MTKCYFLFIVSFLISYSIQSQELISFSSINNTGCSSIISNDPDVIGTGICRSSGVISTTGTNYTTEGWPTGALSPTDYLEWTITPTTGNLLQLANMLIRYQRESTTGPQQLEIRVDYGSGFVTLHQDTSISAAGPEIHAINLSSIPRTGNTVTFRLYAYDSNGSNGDFYVHQSATGNRGILITGTVIPSCSELFISEYHEAASGDEKYIEIYNPTNSAISLVDYRLVQYNNGSTTITYNLPMSGTIPSYGTYVIANDNSTLCPSGVDLCSSSNTMTFNGNDVIALQRSSINIDVIGTIGSSANFAANVVLRRNANVQLPTPIYDSSEWTSNPANNILNLGNHTSDCQAPTPELQLVDNIGIDQNCGYTIDFGNVTSGGGSNDITFNIENAGSATLEISSLGISGDYAFVSPPPTPFNLNSGASQTITVSFSPSANGVRSGVVTINNTDSDENSCIINLTGVGFTPTPEINVEGNIGFFPNISDGDTSPSFLDNTRFDDLIINNESQTKGFIIENLGTGDLTISNIERIGAAIIDFTIILPSPLPITIAPGTEIIFEVTFEPITVAGFRNTTVRITNDDMTGGENIYDFAIRGEANCDASSNTISPSSGPDNTTVTISGNNLGGSTFVEFDGVVIPHVVISATEIEITLPPGASSSYIIVTNDINCQSSDFFTVIDNTISSCEGNTGIIPGDLFISEVTDKGLGSHTYIEIYNGTGAAIDLTNYRIEVWNNGNPPPSGASNVADISGTLINNDTYVIGIGGSDATDPEGSFTADDTFVSVNGINDNDHIRLYYNDGSTDSWIDVWGDPSNPAVSFTVSQNDYTYRRKNSGITIPTTTWNPNDWDDFTPVNYADIGTYDFSTGLPPTVSSISSSTTACNEVTISVSASESFSGGSGLTYQWYGYDPANSALGWQPISNGGIYTASITSPDLIISDPNSVLDYQFYCEVREDDSACYSASNAIKISYGTATWDGANWIWNDGTPANTLPTVLNPVIIDGNYDTSIGSTQTSFEACDCIVNASNTLNIANNTYVLVENDMTVDGTLTVQTQGAFVQRGVGTGAGTFTNNGTANINKQTSDFFDDGFNFHYTYWSSPVTNADIMTVFPNPKGGRRFYFDTSQYIDTNGDDISDTPNDWQSASGSMEVGRGYSITATIPPGFPYNNINIFSGTFNTGDISKSIDMNGFSGDNDWNFVGNPYPSAIDFEELYDQNNTVIEGAAYLWSQSLPPSIANPGNEVYNFNASDYAIITANSGNTAGGAIGLPPNDFIPSGQGFFVKAINIGTLTFRNDMRSTSNNSIFYRTPSADTDLPNRLWLDLTSDSGAFSQILIAYVSGGTDNFDDWSYDAPRNFSTGGFSSLYSIIDTDERKFAIQGKDPNSLDVDELIKVGFYTIINEPTIYKVSVPILEGDFMTNNNIYLKDNLLNTIHNLKDADYTFTSEPGEFNDRFEIVFRADALSLNEEIINPNELTITERSNGYVEIKVGSKLTINHVDIMDMLGRQIYSLKGSNNTEVYNLSKLSKAPYIAKVILSNGQVISKKAIKKL